MTDVAGIVMSIFREELDIEIPGPDVDVIEAGLLDSLGLVTLVFEIEQRCAVSIPFETLEVDDFRTVRSIVRVLEAHQKEGAP
ncbi:MAG: acyl carrier protein [Solirubrobacterales bacterium]